MAKTAEYFRRLPYTRRVRIEADERGEYFVASIAELPGVEAPGSSHVEALAELQHAFDDYVAAMLEWGHEIPEPKSWPESYGWPAASLDFEIAPASIVAMVPIPIDPGAALPRELVEAMDQVRELEHLVETAGV